MVYTQSEPSFLYVSRVLRSRPWVFPKITFNHIWPLEKWSCDISSLRQIIPRYTQSLVDFMLKHGLLDYPQAWIIPIHFIRRYTLSRCTFPQVLYPGALFPRYFILKKIPTTNVQLVEGNFFQGHPVFGVFYGNPRLLYISGTDPFNLNLSFLAFLQQKAWKEI